MLFLETVTGFTCGGADVLKIIKFVKILLDVVLFIVPMGLIIMVSLDLGKNVIAGKDDEMKKNLSVAIKRIIFCVILFLISPIVSFVIKFAGGSLGYLDCLNIAQSDDVWKYKIDWDYYPYDSEEYIYEGTDKIGNYVIYIYTDDNGDKWQLKIYENGNIEKMGYTPSDGEY